MSGTVVADRPPGLRRSTAHMALAGIFQRATGAAGGVIAAHLLGPAGRGVYAIVVLIGAGGALLVTCGLQFWEARRMAAAPSGSLVRRVLRRHASLVLVGLGPVGAAAVLLAPSDLRAAVVAAVVLTMANAGSLVLLAVPTGRRRTDVTALALAAGGAAWLGWLGLAWVQGWSSPALVALGAGASHLVICAVCARWWRRDEAHGIVEELEADHRRAVRESLAPGLGEVVLLSAFRIDVALVAALASPTAAGLYAVATSLAELLWLVPDAVATALLPHVAERPDTSPKRALHAALAGVVVMAVPLLVAPELLITTVFGEDFRRAAEALPWLVVAAVFLGAWKVETAALVAVNRGTVRLTSALVALVVVIVGDLLLVPAHGPRGAAWACAAGYFVAAAISHRAAARPGPVRMGG